MTARSEQGERLRQGLAEVRALHATHHTEEVCPDEDDPDPDPVEIEVCSECGTMNHAEYDVAFRPWPCPTYRAADAALAHSPSPADGSHGDTEGVDGRG